MGNWKIIMLMFDTYPCGCWSIKDVCSTTISSVNESKIDPLSNFFSNTEEAYHWKIKQVLDVGLMIWQRKDI